MPSMFEPTRRRGSRGLAILFNLSLDERETLRAVADERDTTVSGILRAALREYLVTPRRGPHRGPRQKP